MSARYEFAGTLWRSKGAAAWCFATLPQDLSAQVRTLAGGLLNSFGSLRVIAQLGRTSWKTSLFFDTKANAFLLPVKAEVRRKENVDAGDNVKISVEIEF
jgi:hypothetical protein